ncbi:MerR family transcriptional regulator [Aquisalimonas sp. 2447]|uniref:MerR family transcriptional regulator n=1 Tax=Aquisalimonas sp. 2447 TaxID=2740807 RepID=UPI00210FC675|nr:MerR family transcriptional regulator [Aquisalimonas sp. 2447]
MSKGLYPIRTISAMTGVNPVTLRAWERRYGLIRPQRTPKGHRLYTERDIDRIKQILVLMERGIPISQARQVLEQGEGGVQTDATAAAEPHQDVWSNHLERMNTAISVFDEQALDDVYEEALSLFPASQVQHHLLEPLYRRHAARSGSATGAFTCAWLRTVLGVRFRHRVRRASGPRLMLATPWGCHDDVALMLLALEAMDQGYRPLVLCGVAGNSLTSALQDSGAEALLLWSSSDDNLAIPDALDVPVFVAGDGQALDADSTATSVTGDSREIIGALNSHYSTPGHATA